MMLGKRLMDDTHRMWSIRDILEVVLNIMELERSATALDYNLPADHELRKVKE